MLSPDLWHHKPCLTKCWVLTPKGQMVFSLYRLDTSIHTGHRGNMMGQEVNNPRRHLVEMSLRHSASTTFHRTKDLFMSEQIGQFLNLFAFLWLQYDECREWERLEGAGKRDRERGSVKRQFSSHESIVTQYRPEYWYGHLIQSYWGTIVRIATTSLPTTESN